MGTKNSPGSFDCYLNAHPDEPMFVLLGRDPLGGSLVRLWAASRPALNKPGDAAKIAEATDCASAMDAWCVRVGREPRELEATWAAGMERAAELCDEEVHSAKAMGVPMFADHAAALASTIRAFKREGPELGRASNEREQDAESVTVLTAKLVVALAEVERLERLVYVPGLWKCAKCKFSLVARVIHVPSGTMGANERPQECANGCGPMWRVTERDVANEMSDRLERLVSKQRATPKPMDDTPRTDARKREIAAWCEEHGILYEDYSPPGVPTYPDLCRQLERELREASPPKRLMPDGNRWRFVVVPGGDGYFERHAEGVWMLHPDAPQFPPSGTDGSARLVPVALGAAPCRHEWFEGRCVHCRVFADPRENTAPKGAR